MPRLYGRTQGPDRGQVDEEAFVARKAIYPEPSGLPGGRAQQESTNLAEYATIGRDIGEYNYDRPHRGPRDRTPREAFVGFQSDPETKPLQV